MIEMRRVRRKIFFARKSWLAVSQSWTPRVIVSLAIMPDGTTAEFATAARPNAKLGMWLFLVADAVSFAALLFAYAVLRRNAQGDWPTARTRVGLPFTVGMTFVLIASSLTMLRAVAAAQTRRGGALVAWLGATMLGGLLFLAGQAHEYATLVRDKGVGLTTDQMASTFFVCTGFHGAHVLTGVVLIGIVTVRALRGRYQGKAPIEGVEAAGLFWHFVDLIWIVVFTSVYLI
jgi:cytochrome c oxidase subunit 3